MKSHTRFAAPLSVMAILWLLSSLPGTGEGHLAGLAIPEILHNAAHPIAYAVLAVSWIWALGLNEPAGLPWAFGLSILYGMIDELHQAFTPGRTTSLIDLCADAAGAAIGLALVTAWVRRGRHLQPRTDG